MNWRHKVGMYTEIWTCDAGWVRPFDGKYRAYRTKAMARERRYKPYWTTVTVDQRLGDFPTLKAAQRAVTR